MLKIDKRSLLKVDECSLSEKLRDLEENIAQSAARFLVSRKAPQASVGVPAETLPIPVRALAAAIALEKEGGSITIVAVCERAHINRSHFVQRYKKEAMLIKAMAKGDRQPVRGSKVDGKLEAWKDD